MSDRSQLRLGTAPDSWGVWFPTDPHQVTWDVYLDEIARAGYVYTELGPQGFMPQDPQQLNEELARRGLTACGGTVFAGLHRKTPLISLVSTSAAGRGPRVACERFACRAPFLSFFLKRPCSSRNHTDKHFSSHLQEGIGGEAPYGPGRGRIAVAHSLISLFSGGGGLDCGIAAAGSDRDGGQTRATRGIASLRSHSGGSCLGRQ